MIQEKTKHIPHLPGVYIFKDAQNTPIYIGKAKSLKKRVSSYFRAQNTDWKSDLLSGQIADIEYIVTKNETEALLLEADLVKTHQPKFNTLLKDGQPFVYLLISKEALPRLDLVRNKKAKGTYFGPFLYKNQARSVFKFLLDHFQLHVCNKKIAHGCLQYHLGRCAGTCKDDFDTQTYLFRLDLAKRILQGQTADLKRDIDDRIAQHSKRLEFEYAKKLVEIREKIDYVISVIKLHFDARNFDVDVRYALDKPAHALPNPQLGVQLAQLLKLPKEPQTIDCFDISHLQGHNIVGSCVRFTQGIPDKAQFRHFQIKSLTAQDDYAALQEIVQRRYRNISQLPDLILIDGGKGQLNAIKHLFPQTITISLAKREEQVFCSHTDAVIVLGTATEAERLLLALRDYAHHFAITYHRYKRSKELKGEMK